MGWTVKILGALALGAVIATSSSGLTASNTMPAGGVTGYGQTTSTGAVITGLSESTVLTDASKLASVAFTSTTNVTGKTATMTLKSGNTVIGTYPCTLGAYVLTMTITCNTPNNPALAAFDTRGLTIL